MEDVERVDLRDFLDDPRGFRLVARDATHVRLQHWSSSAVTDWIELADLAKSVIEALPAPDEFSSVRADAETPAHAPLTVPPPMTRAYLMGLPKSDLEDVGWDFNLAFVSRATKSQMVAAIVDVQRDDGRV